MKSSPPLDMQIWPRQYGYLEAETFLLVVDSRVYKRSLIKKFFYHFSLFAVFIGVNMVKDSKYLTLFLTDSTWLETCKVTFS